MTRNRFGAHAWSLRRPYLLALRLLPEHSWVVASGLEAVETRVVVEELRWLRSLRAVPALVEHDDLGAVLLEGDERIQIKHGSRVPAPVPPKRRLLDCEPPAGIQHDGACFSCPHGKKVVQADLLQIASCDASCPRLALGKAIWVKPVAERRLSRSNLPRQTEGATWWARKDEVEGAFKDLRLGPVPHHVIADTLSILRPVFRSRPVFVQKTGFRKSGRDRKWVVVVGGGRSRPVFVRWVAGVVVVVMVGGPGGWRVVKFC